MTKDYSLTIEEVSQLLNKSVRTIHRYKDSGRLTFEIGATQGNPLYFSRAEVEALARELSPHRAASAPWDDSQFWKRMERMEHLLATLERNPTLAQLARLADGEAPAGELIQALQHLAALEGQGTAVDRKALGASLIQLGRALSEEERP